MLELLLTLRQIRKARLEQLKAQGGGGGQQGGSSGQDQERKQQWVSILRTKDIQSGKLTQTTGNNKKRASTSSTRSFIPKRPTVWAVSASSRRSAPTTLRTV